MDRRIAVVVGLLVVAGGVMPLAVAPVVAQETVDCSFPITVTDATGTAVTVPDEPDRIVALAPSAAQQLWAVGARDRVVGLPINEYTAYLDGRDNRTDVYGDDGLPVPETVVGLEPDLVLAPNVVRNDTVASLRDAGLTVYKFEEARSIEDVYAQIEHTGRLVGEFEAGAAVSAEMEGTVTAIAEAMEGRDRPRVYYALGDGWTAGNATFVGDLIATAGGDNVADEAGIERYDTISPEIVAETDPEVLVVHRGGTVPETAALNNTTAIRQDNVVRVEANFINQPGPRNVVPLREMAEAFHPAALANATLANPETPVPARCAAVDVTATPTDATTPTTDRTTADTTTTGADGTGFTTVAAAVALATAGLLAGRRH